MLLRGCLIHVNIILSTLFLFSESVSLLGSGLFMSSCDVFHYQFHLHYNYSHNLINPLMLGGNKKATHT